MQAFLAIALLALAACGGAKHPLLEDLAAHQDLTMFKLQSIRGTRDGDRLAVRALISDSSSMLTVDLRFVVGSPTSLQSGTWQWTRTGGLQSGSVTSRSVTFLGGQDGPPSIGGTFNLNSQDGTALYRVALPLMEIRSRL